MVWTSGPYRHYGYANTHIMSGIWCGLTFIVTGGFTLSPESPIILTFRKVMLILSMIFAIFLGFWGFLFGGISTNWLRTTQGFVGVFEGKVIGFLPNSVNPKLPISVKTL